MDEGQRKESRQRDVLVELIEQWMSNNRCYDEHAWPAAKRAIEENRGSYRRRFRESEDRGVSFEG